LRRIRPDIDKSPEPTSTSDCGSATFMVEEQLLLNTQSSEDASAGAVKLRLNRGAGAASPAAKLSPPLVES
jgi:hypothetical protein